MFDNERVNQSRVISEGPHVVGVYGAVQAVLVADRILCLTECTRLHYLLRSDLSACPASHRLGPAMYTYTNTETIYIFLPFDA